MDWPQETIDRLIAHWNAVPVLSTAEIGRRLGISKNATVGKAHRLGLPARPSPIRGGGASEGRPLPAPSASTLPPLASVPAPVKVDPALEYRPPSRTAWVRWFADLPDYRKKAAAAAIHQTGCPLLANGGMWTCNCGAIKAAAAAAKPDRVSKPVAATPEPVAPKGVAQAHLRSTECCWPLGHPGASGFRFCGDPAERGKPYCADHAMKAYVRVKDGNDGGIAPAKLDFRW